MHVIFVEPRFPVNQREFVRALRAAGAAVTGIGESPVEALDDELKSWMVGYEQVPSVCHEPSMLEAVKTIQARGWVDRLETTVEAHILPVAKVREACGIPGTSVRTAFLCRDKPAMKDALREAGVPMAQSMGSDSPEEIREFATKIGYPLILKPRGGAGAAGTYRVDDDKGLEATMAEIGIGEGRGGVAVEEFIEGHEGFYDTLCVGGEVIHEFISHYYPTVLQAMRTRWISPQVVVTNRVDAPGYEEVRQMGKQVIDTLGIGTSATHMEWFFGPKGLKFNEIGCRPPGVSVWDLYAAGNEFDIYREWGNLIVTGKQQQNLSRRFATGMVNLRPERDGRIQGYDGLEAVMERYGEWILDHHFPPPGSPAAPIEGGYKVNAWMRLRHPDYDTLRHMMTTIGESVRVRAG